MLIVAIFAGFFGGLIWWYRRISKDEGPKWYGNFRRFLQTLGEWTATVFAILAFFGGLIFMIFSQTDGIQILTYMIPYMDSAGMALAPVGLVGGFLIIIATKIVLFLLDPVIWLIKSIWSLFVRLVLYIYRCVLKVFGVVEQNSPVWAGVNWIVALLVIVCGVAMGSMLAVFGSMPLAIGTVFTLGLGLAYMGYLIHKRKGE